MLNAKKRVNPNAKKKVVETAEEARKRRFQYLEYGVDAGGIEKAIERIRIEEEGKGYNFEKHHKKSF